MNLVRRLIVGCALIILSVNVFAGDYQDRPVVAEFIAKMVKEHDFSEQQVKAVLNQAVKKQSILEAIARPAEKTKPWFEYRKIFLGQDRIDQGVTFWRENLATLNRAHTEYGVPPQIIVAIIGVETRYGKYMGSHRVVDALATLGFDYPPRSKFFLGQLEQFLILAREQKQDPLTLMGSYAGAMGYGQFIPSSYRHYAKDFDDDGFADIWHNKADAIGSVANYFKAHGWQQDRPVLAPARLTKPVDEELFGDRSRPSVALSTWRQKGVELTSELSDPGPALLLKFEQPDGWDYWFGFNNFYVITRYNRSHLYARAVWELSEAIRKAQVAHNEATRDVQ